MFVASRTRSIHTVPVSARHALVEATSRLEIQLGWIPRITSIVILTPVIAAPIRQGKLVLENTCYIRAI